MPRRFKRSKYGSKRRRTGRSRRRTRTNGGRGLVRLIRRVARNSGETKLINGNLAVDVPLYDNNPIDDLVWYRTNPLMPTLGTGHSDRIGDSVELKSLNWRGIISNPGNAGSLSETFVRLIITWTPGTTLARPLSSLPNRMYSGTAGWELAAVFNTFTASSEYAERYMVLHDRIHRVVKCCNLDDPQITGSAIARIGGRITLNKKVHFADGTSVPERGFLDFFCISNSPSSGGFSDKPRISIAYKLMYKDP